MDSAENSDMVVFSMMKATLAALKMLPLAVAVVLAQNPSPAPGQTVLTPNVPVERSLNGGQTHSYKIDSTEANRFFDVVVDQRGVDVMLLLFAPDGKKLAEVDSPNGATGPERLAMVLENPGAYRLDVRSLEKEAPGRYEIRMAELRVATKTDIARSLGQRAYAAAEELRVSATLQSRRDAIIKYKEAQQQFGSIADLDGEGNAFTGLGRVLYNLGESQPALDAYRQALERKRGVDRQAEAYILHNMGAVYSMLGEMPKALDLHNQALFLQRNLGNRTGEGMALSSIGAIYDDLDEKEKALEYYNKALELRRAVKDQRGEAATLHNMGALYKDLHEYATALTYFKKSLEINVSLGNRKGEAVSCNMMGAVYEMLGEMQTSLDYYSRSLSLNRASGDRQSEAVTLNNIGYTYALLGENTLSLDHYQQALALMRAVGDKWEEGAALDNIGKAYFVQGDSKKALEYFNQSLALRTSLNNRRGQSITLHNLGRVSESQGDRQKAFDYYQQSLALHLLIKDRREESYTLHNLGKLYEESGDLTKALDHLNRAEVIAKELGDRIGETQILYSLASLERNRSNLAGARVILERALSLVETVRTTLSSQALRTSYFASVEKIYRLYTDVLMKMAKSQPDAGLRELAFEAAERRRARSLLELLAESRTGIRRGVDPALLEKERDIQQRLNAKEQRRMQLSVKSTPARIAELDQEIRALASSYDDVRAQIRAQSPRFASLIEPQPVPLPDIRKQILDADTLLLEYSLGDDQSYAWLVSTSGVSGFTLPKRAEIEAAAKKTHEWLASSNRTPRPEAMAALAKMVLAPMAGELGKHRLLIVADGTLEFVPFAALPDPNSPEQPLAVNHELVSLPSASTLALLRREDANLATPPKTVAIIADPVFSEDDSRVRRALTASPSSPVLLSQQLQRSLADTGVAGSRIPRLPGTRREAAAIRALLPSSGYRESLDFDASRETFTGAAVAQAGIVHLATHGLLNTVHPELSGLVLSLVDQQGKPQDGFLRLHEIYNLELKAGLVVLSACQTGLGKEVRGEGLVGLTRGFMYAGAPRVLASLWKVDDRATAELMTHFYKAMMGAEHRTPAAALQAAQVAMWKSKTWTDPYYWAAFSLQGEWN